MTLIQAFFLGAVQGVAEFLPVSSSGHLAVLKHLMELQEVPLLFDVLLHVATLAVVFWVFRSRIAKLIIACVHLVLRKTGEEDLYQLKLIGIILIATFFTGVLGLFLENLEIGAYPRLVSLFFLITGLILVLSRRWKGGLDYTQIGPKQGIIAGIAQGLGVIPGISRSGITISAALLSGMNREKAGEFSFLISLPAILGALLLELKDVGDLLQTVSISSLLVGFVSALVVGFFSLKLLLKLVNSGKLYLFAIYLIPLGLAGLFYF